MSWFNTLLFMTSLRGPEFCCKDNWLPPSINSLRTCGSDLTLLVNFADSPIHSQYNVLQLSFKTGLLGCTIPFWSQSWSNSTTSFPKVPPLELRSVLTLLAGQLFHPPPASVLIKKRTSEHQGCTQQESENLRLFRSRPKICRLQGGAIQYRTWTWPKCSAM